MKLRNTVVEREKERKREMVGKNARLQHGALETSSSF
jgi:hypothetical protein